jgi:hypothetical protein
VPAGEHHVSLRMEVTPPRTIGSAISLAAALFIGAGVLGRTHPISFFRERIWRRGLRLL